jgi:hypothetical protein
VVLLVLFFLLLYLFSFLFKALPVEQCLAQGGYFSPDGYCGIESLRSYLFTEEWDEDYAWEPYITETQFIPTAIEIYGAGSLPHYEGRDAVIWSDLIQENHNISLLDQGLGLYLTKGRGGAGRGNQEQYDTQQTVYSSTLDTEYPYCPSYSSNTDILIMNGNSSGSSILTETFANQFSDAIFSCLQCLSPSASPSEIYFDGILWVSEATKEYDIHSRPRRFQYTYGYINYIPLDADPTHHYMDNEFCPSGIAAAYKNAIVEEVNLRADQNSVAMTYLNTLTNSLLDPSLSSTFAIQASVSTYGKLFFDSQLLSNIAAFLLTLSSVLILNVFFPISVWRLSYERSANISLMMRTAGLKPATYVSGMFLFDMSLSSALGFILLILVKSMDMYQYGSASVGYLVLLILLSSYATCSLSLVLVRISPKRSGILSLLASCLSMGSAVAAGLITQINYPKVMLYSPSFPPTPLPLSPPRTL